MRILKNIYVQCVLLFMTIVGGYAVYANVTYTENIPESVQVITENQEMEITEADVTIEEPVAEERIAEDTITSVSAIDYTGTHIMGDGSVMTGKGIVLTDAVIQTDGTIELSDGTMLTPAFDLRAPKDEPNSQPSSSNNVVIDVSGKNFEYDVKEIRVKKGDTVTINFTSAGGFHDWVLDEFDVATTRTDKGEQASVTFTADTAGKFEYYCSVGSHREMGQVGYLIVE